MDAADVKLIEEANLITCDLLIEIEREKSGGSSLCELGNSSHSSHSAVEVDSHDRIPHLQLLSSLLPPEESQDGLVSNDASGSPHEICLDTSQVQEQLVQLESKDTRCCNCNTSLDGNMNNSKMLHEIIDCQIFHAASDKLLTRKFKIGDFLKILCQINDDSLKNSDLVMCLSCINILMKLYELYNEFFTISLRSCSVLSRVVGSAVKLLQKDVNDLSENLASKALRENKILKNKIVVPKRKLRDVVHTKQGKSVTNCENASDKLVVLEVNYDFKSAKCKTLSQTKHKAEINRVSSKDGFNFHVQQKDRNTFSSLRDFLSDSTSQTVVSLESSETCNNVETSSDTCDRCGKRFKTFGGLKIHYASHVRDDNKVACKECGKKFKKVAALEMHERIDHKGFKPHKCPHEGCERRFRLKDKLKLHIKDVHENNKPYPCPKCEKAFRTRYHLKAHDVAQHVQGDTTIGCTKCRRKFPSKEALEIHVKTHDEEKRFVCPECHKGFKTSSRLKLHAKSHDDLPSAVCSTCGKAYKHLRDLKLHEVVHEGESSYRFACGDCPRKFYRIDLLRVHQSNEKHFSQEVVGPCVTKISELSTKVQKGKTKQTIKLDDESEEKIEISDNKPVMTKPNTTSKRKRKQIQIPKIELSEKIKNNEPLFDCLGSPSLFPNMVQLDGLEDSSSGLEIVELDPTLSNNTISHSMYRRNFPDISVQEQPSFILSTKDPVITNAMGNASTSFGAPVSQPSHFSLPGPATGNLNSIYTIKDSSDRGGLSSFSISAGAEQIGYDVINAFINNLN